MKTIRLGSTDLQIPAVAVGCMRLSTLTPGEMNRYLHAALEQGANFFDHADIYGGGRSEELFGQVLHGDPALHREDMILQSKCGICKGYYDSSREHIVEAVEGSLRRLQTDYLDLLLIHRPDALAEPEEIAAAFDLLFDSGKVRYFGVSNHKTSQIRLLKKYVRQPLVVDQLQLSLVAAGLIAGGIEVNMTTPGAADRDGSALDYCRLNDITIQTWSPFQIETHKTCFLDHDNYPALNRRLHILAEQYGVSITTIAAAWILRHPANFQLIAGTSRQSRLKEIIAAADITVSRCEWYDLYRAAGHPTP